MCPSYSTTREKNAAGSFRAGRVQSDRVGDTDADSGLIGSCRPESANHMDLSIQHRRHTPPGTISPRSLRGNHHIRATVVTETLRSPAGLTHRAAPAHAARVRHHCPPAARGRTTRQQSTEPPVLGTGTRESCFLADCPNPPASTSRRECDSADVRCHLVQPASQTSPRMNGGATRSCVAQVPSGGRRRRLIVCDAPADRHRASETLSPPGQQCQMSMPSEPGRCHRRQPLMTVPEHPELRGSILVACVNPSKRGQRVRELFNPIEAHRER